MSHASHHNILTGAQSIDKNKYNHGVSVRSDRTKSWVNKGYEVIEDSGDSCLMGKRKSLEQLAAEKKSKEDAIRKAKEAEQLKAKQLEAKKAQEEANRLAKEKENADKKEAERLALEESSKTEPTES